MLELKVLVLEGGKEPERREDSLGYDCFSRVDLTINPLSRANVPLGFKAAFDPYFDDEMQWGAFLWDRGKTGNKGIRCLAGVIEGTYRDEWIAILHNTTGEAFTILKGDRVVQCLFTPCGMPLVDVVTELPKSTRGIGKFGSTEVIKQIKEAMEAAMPGQDLRDVALTRAQELGRQELWEIAYERFMAGR